MKPGEIKTVQARILGYAEAIGWTFVPREEAEQRRGFDPYVPPAERAKNRSLFFDDLLDAKLREFNPRYAEAEGALLGQFRHLHTDIYGNREFVEHLRNRGKFFDHEEKRERDLMLIDYDDPARNVFEVTEEWAFHNGHYGTREDVVFLINGIPVLVIECKNANKDEAIALGVDQIRRYHRETPELFVSQQLFTATDAIGFSYGVSWNTVRRNIFNWKIVKPQMSQMGADEKDPKNNLRKSASSAVKEIQGRPDRKANEPIAPQAHAELKKSEFKQRLRHWADKLDVKIVWLGVRPMRNKWASCSTAGRLNFSDELPALKPELWDYVIVHELLHFSVPNHGKLGKSLMRSHLGEYEANEGELKRVAGNKARPRAR